MTLKQNARKLVMATIMPPVIFKKIAVITRHNKINQNSKE